MRAKITPTQQKLIAQIGRTCTAIWKEGKNLKQPPLNQELESSSKRTAKLLRGIGSDLGNVNFQTTAGRMAQCTHTACGHLCCSKCEGAKQRFFVNEADRLRQKHKRLSKLCAVTIIPQDGICKHESLTSIKQDGGTALCLKIYKKLNDAFDKAGITQALGAIDLTLNFDLRKKQDRGVLSRNVEPYWCLHMHLLMPLKQYLQTKQALHEAFPSTDIILKPILMKRLDNDPAAIAYAFGRLTDKNALLTRDTYIPKDNEGAPKRQI